MSISPLLLLWTIMGIPSLFAQERGGLDIHPSPPERLSMEIGIEWGSLYQEGFRNIGKRNFSYLLGVRGGDSLMKDHGFRVMGVHVNLTPARARNHQGIELVDDPSEGLSGRIDSDRLYFDLYPLRFAMFRMNSGAYLLKGAVGVSPAIGYDRWLIRPSRSSTEFLLNGITLGIAVRARLRIMEYFFIEYPFFDLFTFLYRGPSRNALGKGERRVDSGPIGLFSWGTLGFSIPLSRP